MARSGDIRKQYFSVIFDQPVSFKICLLLALLFLMSPIASFAGSKTHTGDELISLTAKDEPLGDVLNKISIATGFEIVLDHKWKSYLVSVALEKVPLHKGLKRILKDLNNVIVYVSSKKIKIIIYDKISPQKGSSAPSNERPLISPSRSYHPPAPDIPDSQDIEREEAPADNPGVSGEASDTGASENDERQNKALESIKTKSDKGTHTDLENKSSGRGSEPNDQSESSSEETERP